MHCNVVSRAATCRMWCPPLCRARAGADVLIVINGIPAEPRARAQVQPSVTDLRRTRPSIVQPVAHPATDDRATCNGQRTAQPQPPAAVALLTISALFSLSVLLTCQAMQSVGRLVDAIAAAWKSVTSARNCTRSTVSSPRPTCAPRLGSPFAQLQGHAEEDRLHAHCVHGACLGTALTVLGSTCARMKAQHRAVAPHCAPRRI